MKNVFRKTVSLPEYQRDLIDSCDNFSAIVSKLIDDNHGLIANNSIKNYLIAESNQRYIDTLNSIEDMADEIAGHVTERELNMITHYIKELSKDRERLAIISNRLSNIESVLNELKTTKKREIFQTVKESIKLTIDSLTNEK